MEAFSMIEMEYVSSSNVEQIGYDDNTSELHVRFLTGPQLYVYLNVPRQVYDDLRMASSKGAFLHAQVYKNYSVEKR